MSEINKSQSRFTKNSPSKAQLQGQTLFGFHAVTVRIKVNAGSVHEVFIDASRRDARMKQFVGAAQAAGVRLVEADGARLSQLCGSHNHQGVVARAAKIDLKSNLNELLEDLEEAGTAPLLLVLDGVTDPHNLGAVLRVADAAGVHAVVAPKDRSVGVNATVAKVASGAAETVPYFMVTNLARTLNDFKARNIWCIGTAGEATDELHSLDLTGGVALVIGAEGDGLRQLTRKTCDQLMRIPMRGSVESLNASVASAVCVYEALRQRGLKAVA